MGVSNKTLAGMLIVAIIISLAGSVVSNDALNRLHFRVYNTGLVTLGNITLEISEAAVANLTDAFVTFESGNVDPGQAYAYLDTNGNKTNWNGSATQDGMEVRNEGNNRLNITVLTAKNGSAFLCEGENYLVSCGVNTTFPPNFSFWAEQNESNESLGSTGACSAPPTAAGTFFRGGNRTVPREFVNSTIEYVTCENLSSTAGQNKFVLEYAMRIPSDAEGVKNNTITITARTV